MVQLAGDLHVIQERLHQFVLDWVARASEITSGEYSTIGPTCWGSSCKTGATASACEEAGGNNIGDRFCVLKGSYALHATITFATLVIPRKRVVQ